MWVMLFRCSKTQNKVTGNKTDTWDLFVIILKIITNCCNITFVEICQQCDACSDIQINTTKENIDAPKEVQVRPMNFTKTPSIDEGCQLLYTV